ncbi:MAG: DUF721 domain-containing protein [Marinifilaceae bacterium]
MMRRKETQKIDDLVRKALRNLGLEERFTEQEVIDIWPEVVGHSIASKTQEVFMNRGTLYVKFTSAVVRNEVSMVKEGLIAALNDKVGSVVVKELILK